MEISVEGFAPASSNDTSGLRFPFIQRALARAFRSEPVARVEFINIPFEPGWAELGVVMTEGRRLCARVDYLDVAGAVDEEAWWETAVRSVWREISGRPL